MGRLVHFNQASCFWARSHALWGTLEEIRRIGEVLERISGSEG